MIGHGGKVVKLRGAVAPTVLGSVLLGLALVSAPLRRRVLLAIRDRAGPRPVTGISATAVLAEPRLTPAAVRRLRTLLGLWGVGLLVVAAAHVVIVFSASTSAFLVESRVSTLGLIGVLIVITRLAGLQKLTPADEADSRAGALSRGSGGAVRSGDS